MFFCFFCVEYIYQVSAGNSAGNSFSDWVAVVSEGSGKIFKV